MEGMGTNGHSSGHEHDPRIPKTSRPALPGRRNAKDALWRVLAAAALLASAMGAGLWAAKTFLLRDWAERVDVARHAGVPVPAADEVRERTWSSRGAERTLKGMSRPGGVWGRGGGNAWMACARGLADARLSERALALALASGAPEEKVWTARGAAALKARQVRKAYRLFGMALAVRPGHAEALKGRAICGARLGVDDEALSAAAAYLGRMPHDAAALRLAAALLCQKSREDEALALLEREVAAGGELRLCLDAAELAARAGAMETALMHLDTAAEGGVPLAAVAQVYKGPLFDRVRGEAAGEEFTRRLVARGRTAAQVF